MSQTGDHQKPLSTVASGFVDDDCYHLSTPAERRKMQNRINQRTHRMRQMIKAPKPSRPRRWKIIGYLGGEDSNDTRDLVPETRNFDIVSDPRTNYYSRTSFHRSEISCRLASPHERERGAQFELTAYRNYLNGSPQIDHLLTLVKLNVYRALAENMAALGMDINGWMHPDAISLFCTFKPRTFDWVIPAHLQPTAIQRAVPHHPWLDFFPHPMMRDRLISASDNFDDNELCIDIMGFWNSNKDDPGLIVWGQPWRLENWEMSEAFLRKWSWTVKDCPELLKSTNHWRTLRGEKRLLPR